MSSATRCRICLENGNEEFQTSDEIIEVFSTFTGIIDLGRYRFICRECSECLRKFQEFKKNCLQSDELLNELEDKSLISKVSNENTALNNEDTTSLKDIELSIKKEEVNPIEKVYCTPLSEEKSAIGDDDHDYMDDLSPSQVECKVTKPRKKKLLKDVKEKQIVDLNGSYTRKRNRFSDLSHFQGFMVIAPLTYEDAVREVEGRKLTSNYLESPLKCELCYRGYGNETAYKNHVNRHSVECGSFECEFCHLRFPSSRIMSKHHNVCHQQKISCLHCDYCCFSLTQAKAHIGQHKGITYSCEHCAAIFNMPNSLLMHKRKKHAAEYVCDACGSNFVTERGLKNHRKSMHRMEKIKSDGPECIECNVRFATETAWKRHIVLSSKHKVENGCDICGETFDDKNALKQHTQNEHYCKYRAPYGMKLPGECPFCKKELLNRDQYRSHMKTEHADTEMGQKLMDWEKKTIICEICGKVFKKSVFLYQHKKVHGTKDPSYQCKICKKSFLTASRLKIHNADHVGRIKCDICEKTFKHKNTLMKHLKMVHLKLRPHTCNVCEKGFPSPYDLKSHKRHVHDKIPWPARIRNTRQKDETILIND